MKSGKEGDSFCTWTGKKQHCNFSVLGSVIVRQHHTDASAYTILHLADSLGNAVALPKASVNAEETWESSFPLAGEWVSYDVPYCDSHFCPKLKQFSASSCYYSRIALFFSTTHLEWSSRSPDTVAEDFSRNSIRDKKA